MIDELKENIINIVRKYINDIKLEEDNIYKPEFDLSYIIPCFYEYYIKLSDYINQNIKTNYFKNEKRMRSPPSEKKISRNDLQEKFNKNENDFLLKSYEEANNYKYFSDFFNEINNSELILNDYITYYLQKYDSDGDYNNFLNNINLSYNDNKHKLIILLLGERFNEKKRIIKINNDEPLKLFLIKINWIEANSDYIIRILKIYDILKDLFDENEYIKIIEKIMKEETLRYITNEKKNPEITTEVNECFYKILASFCYSIIPPYINFDEKIETYNYIKDLKKAMIIIRSLNSEFYTYSIEVELLEELIEIYDVFELNQKLYNKKGLTSICNILKKNNYILQKSKDIQSEELIEEFKNLINAINDELKYNDKKYFDLLKFIYFKETKKVPNVYYRTAIFQEMIKDVEILIKSNDILQILLYPIVKPNKDDFPKSIKSILKAIDYDIALIIENILENENEDMKIALEDTLLYYFEKNSFMYFDNIFNGEEKIYLNSEENIKEDKKIIGPLKLFSDCINYLNDYINKKYKENKNICKLFCIGYIKAYCYTFIHLSDSGSPYLKEKIKIIQKINNARLLTKDITFYIGKIIYNKNKKNINLFIDPDYRKAYQIDNYICFKDLKQDKNPFTYNYICQQNKENYDKFNQILEKYKSNEFEKINLKEFIINKYDIDIFYFSTSIIILSQLKQKQSTESPIYKNFYNNICIPLFKNKDKTFNAIKLLYEPLKFKIIEFQLRKGKQTEKDLNIIPENLNIILQSYRYFINEINSNSKNSIFSVFYERHIETNKINDNYYPGNDIKDKPIYSIYSKIEEHFRNIPSEGCFVCLCKEGGFYHNVKGGIPEDEKYLNLKCIKCGKEIGAIKDKERNLIIPVKRNKYFRIFKTEKEAEEDRELNDEKYNCMSLEEFKNQYILEEYKEEKGIPKNSESFFRKDNKIIRCLSYISYRILNFIIYSHIIFSKLYNNNTAVLDIYLLEDMSLIQILIDCWEMIKIELNKVGIYSIDIFMNYIFPDLFNYLNKQEKIKDFDKYIEIEKALDDIIQNKILDFKENYKRFIHYRNTEEKISFQDLIEERYDQLNKEEYPFYNYFYYVDYINEDILLDILKYKDQDKYPVLLKVLQRHSKKNKNKYSLDNLPIFNEILNLFNDTYYNSITRDKAESLQLKNIKSEDVYIDNKKAIKNFIQFYNNLSLKDEKGNKLLLSDESKLADFLIIDDNEFGKSYKYIYSEFIKEQNKEIADLLENKIQKGIFEKDCKIKINIQNANLNEIFIVDLPDNFSFKEAIFNSSNRTFAITKNYNVYNNFEIYLDILENRMTELLLRNKKLFDNFINVFFYAKEILEFNNKNIIAEFNELFDIEKINLGDKKILYQIYDDNKENDNLLKNIFDDFIQLILFLNKNKKIMNNKKENEIYLNDKSLIFEVIEKLDKISEDFKNIFKDKENLTISKITYLFEYYRDLIFRKIKSGFIKTYRS